MEESGLQKVRYEELLPHEMEEIMSSIPIAFLPLGTLEWHGPHLGLGNDAVKAYELCLRVAQKTGGVVVPATFWAIGGMPHPWTTRFDKELIGRLFYAIFEQLSHVGFKVVIAVTGHYGLEQVVTLKKEALKFMRNSSVIVFPIAEYEVTPDTGYHGDHAAKWETSILWYLRPKLVDMSKLPKDEEPLIMYEHGIGGEDPRASASQKMGKEISNTIISRLAKVALRLLRETSPLQRNQFISGLTKQIRIFDEMKLVKPTKEESEAVRESYRQFLNHFWQGNYIEAHRIIDSLLVG